MTATWAAGYTLHRGERIAPCVRDRQMKTSRQQTKNKKGQSLVEYGIILVLVAIVVFGALTHIGGKVSNKIDEAGVGLQPDAEGQTVPQ